MVAHTRRFGRRRIRTRSSSSNVRPKGVYSLQLPLRSFGYSKLEGTLTRRRAYHYDAFNVGVLIERIGSLSGSLVAVLAVAQPLTTACSGDRPTFGRPAPDAAAPIPSTDTDAATSTDSTTRTAPTTGSDAGLDTPTPDEGIDGAVGEEMIATELGWMLRRPRLILKPSLILGLMPYKPPS